MLTALARKSIRLGNSLAQQLPGNFDKIDVAGFADHVTANECVN